MSNVTVESLLHSADVVILEAKLLTGLPHDGRDLLVVGLDDAREEVVSDLVVESTGEDTPEPAVCGVVLRRGNLQLGPECEVARGSDAAAAASSSGAHSTAAHTCSTSSSPVLVHHLVLVRLRPLHLKAKVKVQKCYGAVLSQVAQVSVGHTWQHLPH